MRRESSSLGSTSTTGREGRRGLDRGGPAKPPASAAAKTKTADAAYTGESRSTRSDGAKRRSGPAAGRDLYAELLESPGVPAARIFELRQAAIEYVERALKVDIGALSEDALAYVDHYLETARQKGALPAEIKALLAAAFGVFLGELLISRFGGRWLVRPGADGAEDAPAAAAAVEPRRFRLGLEAAPLVLDPVGMAAAALYSDEELEAEGSDPDDEVEGMITRRDLSERLDEALARVSPVSSDFYYSLTGRFESICYAADVLIDLQKPETPTDETDPNAAADADGDVDAPAGVDPQVKT